MFIDGSSLLSQEGTTQGDPLAMPMYAIGIVPVIQQLKGLARQVWYADDAAAGGSLLQLRDWWSELLSFGRHFGYHVNAAKTWLVVKPEHLAPARHIFDGTGIQITSAGRVHLWALMISSQTILRLKSLSGFKVCHSYPQSLLRNLVLPMQFSYMVFPPSGTTIFKLIQSLMIKYLLKIMPSVTSFYPPLFPIPPMTWRGNYVFSLPISLGSLGICDPHQASKELYEFSCKLSRPLVDLILQQCESLPHNATDSQYRFFKELSQVKHQSQIDRVESVLFHSPDTSCQALECCWEKGASSWLSVIPVTQHGSALHKIDFTDALCLRYGWSLAHLPSHCVCGKAFNICHALSCPHGAFPTICHNDFQDLTARLMSEVCHDVQLEPHLHARVNIRAAGFWGCRHHRSFFDVRVFNTFAESNQSPCLAATFRRHEGDKRRAYEECIREVEQGSFTLLVFSSSGGMGKAASVKYKRLASLLSEKWNSLYSLVMGWLCCSLGFSLLRSSLMCLRGSQSRFGSPVVPSAVDLVVAEGHLSTNDT